MDFLQLVKDRKSTRVPYDENRGIAPNVLESIFEAATYAPTAHNMQNFEIVVVDDKSILEALSNLESPVSSAFIQDNYREVSFSEDELKKRKTGILADRFPPEWFTLEAKEGKIDTSKFHNKLGEGVRRGPVLLLILYDPNHRAPGSEGDFLGVMSLGFVLENMWLMATAQGLSFRIISAFGNEPLSSEVKKMLNIPEALNITLGIVLGYDKSDDNTIRVRRDIKDFVHFNSYE